MKEDIKIEREVTFCDDWYMVRKMGKTPTYADAIEWADSHPNWIKINRDKWGFLADEMMEQMYSCLPIIIWDSKYESAEFVDKHNWGDWLSDLEGKPYYSHYLPIVLPKED